MASGGGCGVSGAAPAHAQTVEQDFVTADVNWAFFHTAQIEARSGPQGENPTGFVGVSSRGGRFASVGPVTCLTVTGNRATIGFENLLFDPGGEIENRNRGLFVFVEDNGTSGDKIAARGLDAPPTICPPNTFVYTLEDTVERGVLTVHDAKSPPPPQPRRPTSKEQCKNGGYKAFGFKSPGQCVAFAQRGPSPS